MQLPAKTCGFLVKMMHSSEVGELEYGVHTVDMVPTALL